MSNRHSEEISKLNAELNRIKSELDKERKCHDELVYLCKMTEAQSLWNYPVDAMNKDQLQLLKKSLEEVKNFVAKHADRLFIQSASTKKP
jgi:hypothetical protein